MSAYELIEWGTAAILALGASLVVLKVFRWTPIWAVVIGMIVFTGLQFPIKTHAVMIDMPPPTSK
jgi:hypothetical protein